MHQDQDAMVARSVCVDATRCGPLLRVLIAPVSKILNSEREFKSDIRFS